MDFLDKASWYLLVKYPGLALQCFVLQHTKKKKKKTDPQLPKHFILEKQGTDANKALFQLMSLYDP